MLSKSICKKCAGKRYGWTESDERAWHRGWMRCPSTPRKVVWPLIKEFVPNYCPFILEHLMEMQHAE